jgi:hypothetical protein
MVFMAAVFVAAKTVESNVIFPDPSVAAAVSASRSVQLLPGVPVQWAGLPGPSSAGC